MVIRSTALQSALAGMTVAHNQVAAAAQNLAKPLFASPTDFSSAGSSEDAAAGSPSPAPQSMSADVGSSLVALNESLTLARASSVTAGAAQAMLEDLLEIGRR